MQTDSQRDHTVLGDERSWCNDRDNYMSVNNVMDEVRLTVDGQTVFLDPATAFAVSRELWQRARTASNFARSARSTAPMEGARWQ